MSDDNDRLNRIERILRTMAGRQQYHDDAFERFDAEMKTLREAMAIDAEKIQALLRIAELRQQRPNRLEGDGEPA